MMVLYFSSLSEIQIFVIDMRVYETRVAFKPWIIFFHREQYAFVRMNNILNERALQ